MPKINVSRSKTINSSVEDVYSKLNDFNHWVAWSPWLIMEPGVNVTIQDDAKYYEWKGNRVGEGNMRIVGEQENQSIDYDLNFLKPWKSKAKVKFIVNPDGDATKVTWTMDSSVPFFMFWMKKMMISFIGSDYDRGLNLLKDYIEKGEVQSRLEFKGESKFAGTKYIGVQTTCGFDEMGEVMMADFGKLEGFMGDHKDIATGEAYTIYHKWDMVKQTATYTGCVGVTSIPEGLPEGFLSGEIKPTKIYTLRHIGPYEQLGNAWTTMYTMVRSKEFKAKKGVHPFEHYVTNPQDTEPKDSITDVIFAIQD